MKDLSPKEFLNHSNSRPLFESQLLAAQAYFPTQNSELLLHPWSSNLLIKKAFFAKNIRTKDI